MYDALVIGGGHNGLVAAAYLARAGRRVLVLERRPVLGGACVTEEVFPGYKVSTAAYLCSLFRQRIVDELRLADFGYHVYPKDPAYFSPFPDGRYLFLWQDRKRSLEEIARFSERDARRYPEYEDLLGRLADFVEPLLLTAPPNLHTRSPRELWGLAGLALRALRLNSRELATFIKIMTASVRDFLDEWFESEELKTALATDGVIGTNAGPYSPGTAYVLFHHSMGGVGGVRGLWGFVRGGMGGIAAALAAAARSHGAEIKTGAEVERILVKDGRALGVVLAGGEEVRARAVLSNADPKRTFLKLVGREHLDEDFAREIERIKMQGCSLKINLALGELPDFKAYPGAKLGPQHRGTIHICPSLDYIERAWDDAKFGRPSANPMLEITIPTAYEPELAPPGKHIMNIFVQYAPYRLSRGSWRELRDEYADRIIDLLSEYVPNIKSAIIHRQVLTPLDLEETFGLTGGNIFHGEMSLDQLFFMRPRPGWARYRTPIAGLYLCGAGAHPGGGVMGAAGYNAAREVLRSLK